MVNKNTTITSPRESGGRGDCEQRGGFIVRHILDFIESLDKEGARPDLYMASEESSSPEGTGHGGPVRLPASKETQTEKSASWKLMTLHLWNFI